MTFAAAWGAIFSIAQTCHLPLKPSQSSSYSLEILPVKLWGNVRFRAVSRSTLASRLFFYRQPLKIDRQGSDGGIRCRA